MYEVALVLGVDTPEALDMLQGAVVRYRTLLPASDPALVMPVVALAAGYCNVSRFQEALQTAEEARRLCEGTGSEMRYEAADMLAHVVALAHSGLGNEQAVLDARKTVVRIRKNHFGDEHIEVAKAITELADTLLSAGDVKQAIQEQTAALEMLLALFGNDHPSVVEVLLLLIYADFSCTRARIALRGCIQLQTT